MNILVSSSGKLRWNDKEYRCALGKNGVVLDKREGDGATPLGCFSIREVLYRADRVPAPMTVIPVSVIQPEDGWCDDVCDSQYNQKVRLPYTASYESLWRGDEVYDVIVTIGYNDAPVIPRKGSAIFMHIARPDYTPTAGCVTLSLPDLLQVLSEITKDTMLCIES